MHYCNIAFIQHFLGLITEAQYVVTLHADTDHDHVNITANRIQLDGSVISDSNIHYRSHEVTREAEKAAGLTILSKDTKLSHKGKISLHLGRFSH